MIFRAISHGRKPCFYRDAGHIYVFSFCFSDIYGFYDLIRSGCTITYLSQKCYYSPLHNEIGSDRFSSETKNKPIRTFRQWRRPPRSTRHASQPQPRGPVRATPVAPRGRSRDLRHQALRGVSRRFHPIHTRTPSRPTTLCHLSCKGEADGQAARMIDPDFNRQRGDKR